MYIKVRREENFLFLLLWVSRLFPIVRQVYLDVDYYALNTLLLDKTPGIDLLWRRHPTTPLAFGGGWQILLLYVFLQKSDTRCSYELTIDFRFLAKQLWNNYTAVMAIQSSFFRYKTRFGFVWAGIHSSIVVTPATTARWSIVSINVNMYSLFQLITCRKLNVEVFHPWYVV